jgi:hypothetical protein
MGKREFLPRAAKLVFILLAVIGLAGATIDKRAPSQEAVTLVYQFAQGAPLSYKQTTTQVQNIDAMGQLVTTDSSQTMDITLTPKGLKDGNHLLGVTIDGLVINVQGPQGNQMPDLKDIIGKSFDLVLSPRGEEVDVSGASGFYIETAQGIRRDMTSDFQGLFPDLPDHPVKVGETWPSVETITQKSDAGDVQIVFKNENTLDGFETIDGRECARIKTAVHGVTSGSLSQGGMSFTLSGKLEGSETSYFAFKEGIFIRSEMAADMDGVIDAMGTTIGFTGQQRNALALVKK